MKKIFFSLILGVILFPVGVLLLSALGTTWTYPDLFPRFGEGFFRIGPVRSILLPVSSSVFYASLTVLVTLLITLPPAKFLAYSDFKGKKVLEGILLLPAVISPFTFLMGIQFILLKIGLGNSYSGVIIILSIVSYPYMLRALEGGYSQINPHIFTCAENLGASPLYRILKVELPMIIPSFIAGANIVFLVAFSDYLLVFVMGGAKIHSLTLTIFPLLTSSARQIASLYNLFFLFVPLILFLIIDGVVLSFYRRNDKKGNA